MSVEEWRPIPGFPGYEVSDQGRVLSRVMYRGSTGPRIKAQHVNRQTGYMQVACRVDGRTVTVAVHAAVAAAFLGPRPSGQHARHLNGDQSDNSLGNLRYGTVHENQLDQVRHGTHAMARRTHCKNGHAFTPETTCVREVPGKFGSKTVRVCLTCKRARGLLTWRRKRVQQLLSEGMTPADLIARYPHLGAVIETRELRAA